LESADLISAQVLHFFCFCSYLVAFAARLHAENKNEISSLWRATLKHCARQHVEFYSEEAASIYALIQ
jgi:hypothetical protein